MKLILIVRIFPIQKEKKMKKTSLKLLFLLTILSIALTLAACLQNNQQITPQLCTHKDNNSDGICDICGTKVATTHTECTDKDKDGRCDTCGKKTDNEENPEEPDEPEEPKEPEEHKHTLDKVEAVEATCSTDGNTEYYRCSECKKLFSDKKADIEISLSDTVVSAAHTGGTEIRGERAATENEEGYTGDTYCLGCDEKLADGETIERLPHTHNTTKIDRIEATCTENGNIEYWVCLGCNKTFSNANATAEISNVIITAHHTGGTEVRGAIEATEYTDGYSGDTYCLGCNVIISHGHTVPHTSDAPAVTVSSATVCGDEARIVISLVNNPGIISLKFNLLYDEALSIKSIEFADELGAYVTAPSPYINPQTFNWINPMGEIDTDGEFITVIFAFDPTATDETTADIRIVCDNANIFDSEMNAVSFNGVGASVALNG